MFIKKKKKKKTPAYFWCRQGIWDCEWFPCVCFVCELSDDVHCEAEIFHSTIPALHIYLHFCVSGVLSTCRGISIPRRTSSTYPELYEEHKPSSAQPGTSHEQDASRQMLSDQSAAKRKVFVLLIAPSIGKILITVNKLLTNKLCLVC